MRRTVFSLHSIILRIGNSYDLRKFKVISECDVNEFLGHIGSIIELL